MLNIKINEFLKRKARDKNGSLARDFDQTFVSSYRKKLIFKKENLKRKTMENYLVTRIKV